MPPISVPFCVVGSDDVIPLVQGLSRGEASRRESTRQFGRHRYNETRQLFTKGNRSSAGDKVRIVVNMSSGNAEETTRTIQRPESLKREEHTILCCYNFCHDATFLNGASTYDNTEVSIRNRLEETSSTKPAKIILHRCSQTAMSSHL